MMDIGTGLRRGELLGLQRDCVDLERKTITVRRSLVRRLKGAPVIHEPKTAAGG
jgi:integrase